MISTLLEGIIPSSAWTEHAASKYSEKVYTTSLKTAFPISVTVYGVPINITRVIVVSTAEVNIDTGSVTDMRITSVSLG